MAGDNEMKTLDYGVFLADLEAKRAVLDQAIASVKAVMASGAMGISVGDVLPVMTDSASIGLHGGEIPVGAFLGKSIPEAAKLCLQITKKKLTARDIAEALQKGGIETKAKTSFPAIVHAVLRRVSTPGSDIVKIDRSHWGLAEWYPSSMRVAAATKRAKGKKRQKVAQKVKEQAPASKSQPEAPSQSVPERISQLLQSKPGTELSAKEIAAPLGIKSNVAALLLGKLIARKRVEKTPAGKYRAMAA